MRLWSTLVLIIAAALVAGPAPAPPVAPPTVLLAAQAGVVRLDPTAQCPVRGDFEGQFADSSEMPVFLECVLGGVEAWIDATYKNIPHPRAYYFASHGTRGENGCRGGFDADTLAYCPASQSVYLGADATGSVCSCVDPVEMRGAISALPISASPQSGHWIRPRPR